jgi:serine/threonine-protein kinase
LVGTLVKNRYRVEDIIGEGGVCVVYRGEDISRGRKVAIKVLPIDRAGEEQFAQRFRREVATVRRIAHPSVPTIFDSGELDDGALFLVMELLQGRLLSQIVEEGPLEPRRAMILARQMLVGLEVAHRQGIVHRDVKPKNVMVIDVSGIEAIKLFDFGIASNERAAIKLTLPGVAFGTPGYISPEMAKGDRVDARADVYSVGVTLFEMVTGRLPFSGADDLQMVRAQINSEPPSPRELQRDVSPELERIILRAMRKAPAERFASARAMVDAIDLLLEDRRRRDRRWLVAVLLVAALAWLAGWLIR